MSYMILVMFLGLWEGGRLVGWSGGAKLLRHRWWGGVCRSSSGRDLVGVDVHRGGVRQGEVRWGEAHREWKLSWETKINPIALADIQQAKATRAESNVGGSVGVHCVHGVSSGLWEFMSIVTASAEHASRTNLP